MAKETETSGNAETGRPQRPTRAAADLFQEALDAENGEDGDEGDEGDDEDEGSDEDLDDEDSDDEGDEPDSEDEDLDDEETDDEDGEEEAEDELGDEDADDEDSDDLGKIGHKLVTITVDGKREKVTVSEAAQGYMRTKAFTQKTMEVAEKRKKADAEIQVYGGLVTQLRKHLDAVLTPEKEPDWEALREEDPAEYAARRQEWRDLQEQRDAAKAEEQRLKDADKAKMSEELEQYLAEQEKKLLEALPQWKKDPETAKRESRAIRGYLRKNGFNDDEIKNLVDHRAILLIRKAALFDRQKDKVKGKIRPGKKVKTLRPGARNDGGQKGRKRSVLRKAEQRLRKNGRAEDLATIFLASGELDDIR